MGKFPDVLEGKLLLTRQDTMNGLAGSVLWIRSDTERYEIVLTKGTLASPDWRRKGEKYSVTLNGVEFFVLPEGLTNNRDGTTQITLNSAITDRQGHILVAYPLVGRYSVQGRIAHDTEKIEAGEIKYLGTTP